MSQVCVAQRSEVARDRGRCSGACGSRRSWRRRCRRYGAASGAGEFVEITTKGLVTARLEGDLLGSGTSSEFCRKRTRAFFLPVFLRRWFCGCIF